VCEANLDCLSVKRHISSFNSEDGVGCGCGCGRGVVLGGGATVYLVHGLLDLAQADVQVHLLLLQLAALLVEQVGVVVDEVQVVARRDGHGARATLRQPVVGLRRGRREKECNNNNTFYL